MSNQSIIPVKETRARHIAKLRELNRRMDKHIMDLDELNALLKAELCEQRRTNRGGPHPQPAGWGLERAMTIVSLTDAQRAKEEMHEESPNMV